MLDSDQIVTLLAAIVVACGASIVTGLFGMPRLRSENKSSQTNDSVAISGDARAWAQQFAERASAADIRAAKAEARAARAEEHADRLDMRCDELEELQLKTAAYARVLRAAMVHHGWTDVPEPPPDVEPFVKA